MITVQPGYVIYIHGTVLFPAEQKLFHESFFMFQRKQDVGLFSM